LLRNVAHRSLLVGVRAGWGFELLAVASGKLPFGP
jgi:hypothetical protein